MIVRKATLGDIELLIKLRIDYMSEVFEEIDEEKLIKIKEQLPVYFKKHLEDETFIAVLAEEKGELVSAAYLAIAEKPANLNFINGKTGTLLNVLTYPEHRRKGYSYQVVSKMIEEAKKLEVTCIELSATASGIEMYKQLGFSIYKHTMMTKKL